MSSLAFTAGAWLWDKYGETVTNKAADTVKGRWKKFKWGTAAEAYRAKIKKLYGTMQIMGMAEPVPLDDIFTEAYMLDKPTAFGRFDKVALAASCLALGAEVVRTFLARRERPTIVARARRLATFGVAGCV